MHNGMTTENEEGRALRAPAGTNRQSSSYPTSPSLSRDLPPASSEALGLLTLTLSAREGELPARQARQGWALAERWLRQLVETKDTVEVA